MTEIAYAAPPSGDGWWPYCKRCGAVVPPQALTLHDAWHEDVERTAQRAYNAAADRLDG